MFSLAELMMLSAVRAGLLFYQFVSCSCDTIFDLKPNVCQKLKRLCVEICNSLKATVKQRDECVCSPVIVVQSESLMATNCV